jgi:chemotaxis protein methyltransferase CheR
MDDQQFSQLLQRLGLSWPGYRRVRKGVKKRIHRHMQLLGHQKMATYLAELDKSDELRRQCYQLMTVSVSRFFRDRKLWEILEDQILPEIIKKGEETIRIWSAGCASGEEVYSLKIVLERMKKRVGHFPKIDIVGTDVNPVYLDRARAGVYLTSSLREVPSEFRALYFIWEAENRVYSVITSLKKDIVWKTHNLFSEPPGSLFDLIFLRNNLLTYYQEQTKKPGFINVIRSLKVGGFLVIGSHEQLPRENSDLFISCSHPSIFKRPG